MLRNLIFLLFVVFTFNVHSFAQIDSLLNSIPLAKHDTSRCLLYLACGDYYEYISTDSAEYYYTLAEKIANKHLRNNKKLSTQEILTYADILSKALRYKAIIYINNNLHQKPIEKLLNQSLAFARITKNIKAQAACFSNIGVYYFQKSLFDKAVVYQLEALKLYEKINDEGGLANVYMNLANLYTIQKENNKAISAYQKSKHFFEKLGKEYFIARVQHNMAILYKNQQKFSLAESLYKQALSTFKKYGDSSSISNTLINIGILIFEQSRYDEAIYYYKQALRVLNSIKDTNGIIISLVNLSECLITKYDSSQEKNIQWVYEALEYAKQAYRLNEKIGSLHSKNMAARCLMQAYYNLKQYQKAINFARIYVESRDSLFSQEKSKAIAEAEALYKTEKQQRLIEKLNHEKALNLKTIEAQQAENKRQQTTIYAIISVSVLLVVLLSVVAYFLRINQIHNRQLKVKNYQISKQKEEIALQRDEIAEQRDIVIKQKTQIEAYHKALKDSIYYAESIQKAVIPDEIVVKNILGQCFVLFMPRDIVSGDFYWIKQQQPYIYFAVADCTGHGVPGAFMSMMAVSFLNEQFHKNNLKDTAQTMEILRSHIIQSFKLNEHSVKMKDGLDMIFVIYNTDTRELSYSGANNPLYIIRKADYAQFEIIELQPDKMPVGFHTNMIPFNKHTLTLSKEDTLYFTTDGYGDQFGGTLGKKFLRKRLKETLLQIAHEPLPRQKDMLFTTLEQWRTYGNEKYPQTDDITIIGWHIN
ncbi:MAG: tetratricopeptide repeat protein [Bacteroidales bacterium]|nr:tetratricopeptide repeat protein [Bacteroidales bacterium]